MKKITNFVLSLIIAFAIMGWTYLKFDIFTCGYKFQNPNCPIYIWIIQGIIIAIIIFIIMLILRKIFKKKESEEEPEEEIEELKIGKEKKEAKKKVEKKAKKEMKSKLKWETGDEVVERWPDEEEIKI